MTVQTKPLAEVKRLLVSRGIAGQSAITAFVTYSESGIKGHATFVGSSYGGSVVMIMESGHQVFVDEPQRFGAFGREWVRRFYA